MGVVFRQSVKGTLVTFAGAALGGILLLYSAQVMPKQELGFVRNLPVQAVVASFFFVAGMGNTLFFYLHRFDAERQEAKKAVLLSLSFLLPALLYGIGLLLYFIFKDNFLAFFQPKDRPLMRSFFWALPLYAFFYLMSLVLEAYLNAHIRTAQASFVREVFVKGANLCLFAAWAFGVLDFNGFVAGFVTVYVLAAIIMLLMAKRLPDFTFSVNWKSLSRGEYKSIMQFSLFHAFMGISGTLLGFLDTQLLSGLDSDGLSAVAVYTTANFFSTLVSMPYRALSAPAAGNISRAYAHAEHEKVADLYNRAGLNIFLASLFMAALIVCNLHNAVAILPKGYEAVLGVTLILLIGRLADGGTGLNDLALNMSPFYRKNFYLSLTTLGLMCVGFIYFIPKYGVYGAAWVFTTGMLVLTLAKAWIVWRKMHLHPLSKGTWQTMLITLLCIAVIYPLPKAHNPYWDTIWRSCLLVLLFAGGVFWLKPGKDVSDFFKEVRKKKRLF